MVDFEDLPAPLTLFICLHLPDLKSLDALTRASPRFATEFARNGIEIIEAIMKKTMSEVVITCVRIHIAMQALFDRRTAFTFQSFEEEARMAVKPLPLNTSTLAASITLKILTRLHCIAIEIISAKLDCLRKVEYDSLRHKNLAISNGQVKPLSPTTWIMKPLSPPTWIEEQRVLLALLKIDLCSSWVAKMELADSSDHQDPRRIDQHVEYFKKLVSKMNPLTCRNDEFIEVFKTMAILISGQIEIDMSNKFLYKYLDTLKTIEIQPNWCSAATMPDPSHAMRYYQETGEHFQAPTEASRFFRHALPRRGNRSFPAYDWSIFREVGFGLLDSQHLVELRLLPNRGIRPKHICTGPDDPAYQLYHRHFRYVLANWAILYDIAPAIIAREYMKRAGKL